MSMPDAGHSNAMPPPWRRPDPRRQRPDPQTWEEPEMLTMLARRDITRVYRLLHSHGYSQQHIAALTGPVAAGGFGDHPRPAGHGLRRPRPDH